MTPPTTHCDATAVAGGRERVRLIRFPDHPGSMLLRSATARVGGALIVVAGLWLAVLWALA